MAFLTDLDDRAEIKGSRDPLGLVPLWSRFGRYVVGNLTTVTNSVRGFTTLLLGYYFAQQVREGRGGTAQESTLNLFLKFEQLAAYCRQHARNDGEFRGVERVKKRLGERSSVTISAEPNHQILGNQKIYGLWGLFSVAARSSGLLEQHEPILTPVARDLVEQEYIARLTAAGMKDGKAIIDVMSQKSAELRLEGRHAALAECLATILGPRFSRREHELYHAHLVLGGSEDRTWGLQAQLATLLNELPTDTPFDKGELRAVIKEAKRRGSSWEALSKRLREIDQLESLITTAASAFGFLLARHGQRLAKVAVEISKAWGQHLTHFDVDAIRVLRSEIARAQASDTAAERWIRIAEHLSSADYETFLQYLIEQNASVMQERGGSAPWVRLENGTLDVRFREETRDLPDRKTLPDLWDSTYFINSLKDVSMALRRGAPSPQRKAA